MINLFGTGIGKHIDIGRAYVVQGSRPSIEHQNILPEDVDSEIKRLNRALAASRKQLKQHKRAIPAKSPIEAQTIIDAQLLMLQDPMLVDATIQLIENDLCSAETAVDKNAQSLMEIFHGMDDHYLRNKTHDVQHLTNTLLNSLLNITEHSFADVKHDEIEGRIIVSNDISPAEAAHISLKKISSFITDLGGPISHTAIVAKSMNIPAVVGIKNATQFIRDGDLLVIDAALGTVLVNPDADTIAAYKKRKNRLRKEERDLQELIKKPVKTLDGEKVQLLSNIESSRDLKQVKRLNIDGVGLFRTEYLFMDRAELPTEQEQFLTYKNILKSTNKQITIRTLDIGADKQLMNNSSPLTSKQTASNSSPLGLRAIRLSLAKQELFIPQIRAMLRASAYGKMAILIPLLSNIEELNQTLSIIAEVKQDLRQQKLNYDSHIKVGAMIEVPAAAINADAFAERLDFLSIGTNDLIQYTLAIDRIDQSVNYLYDPLHPAILRLIKMTIKAANKANIPISLCGEMAANPEYTKLLLAMGLRSFSDNSSNMLQVKQQILKTQAKKLKSKVNKLLNCHDSIEMQFLLQKINDA